jgi:protein SCO1/2
MSWYEKRYSSLPVLGPRIDENGKSGDHTIASFSLMNQDEKVVTNDKWKGKIVVAHFFFSTCPTVCPAMIRNLQKVYDMDSELLIQSFSVDPQRDSAAQLRTFSKRMKLDNHNWDLLTGDKKEIYRLARNSFLVVATDGDGGAGDFIHSEKVVLIDKQRRIRGYYQGTNETEMNQLVIDIKKLKNEN